MKGSISKIPLITTWMKINEPKTYNTNLTSAAELLGSSKSIREINFSNMSRLEFKFDEGYNINY